MNLAQSDQARVDNALAQVRRATDALMQQPDTEALKTALGRARDALVRAAMEVNDAEQRTREAALRKLETA